MSQIYYDPIKNYINDNILVYFPSAYPMDLYHYTLTPINNVPIFTYAALGVTTIVLATITLVESVNQGSDESMFSKLPGNVSEEKPMVGGPMVGGGPIVGGSSKRKSRTYKKR